MKRLVLLSSLLFALPSALASCDGLGVACTEIGCDDSVTLAVSSTSGALAAGTYTLSVSGSGESASCSVTFDATAQVVDTTCDLLDNTAASFTVILHTAPETFSVTIDLDGVEQAKQDFTPSYTINQPNGPDCEPTCHEAQESMDIP